MRLRRRRWHRLRTSIYVIGLNEMIKAREVGTYDTTKEVKGGQELEIQKSRMRTYQFAIPGTMNNR